MTQIQSLDKQKSAVLVLGTAQLGQPYGVANRTGMPSQADAVALVRQALASGVRHVDTARAYGDSEQRVGLALSEIPVGRPDVTTKLDPLSEIGPAAPGNVTAMAERSLAESRAALGQDRLDAVLLHRACHQTSWGGAVWSLLRHERDAGRIGRIGVSVQTPDEALGAIANPQTEQIQMPFNLLDHRWASAGVIEALCNRSDIVVHVRSVFLQGLLVGGDGAHWPANAQVDVRSLLQQLENLKRELDRADVADLCLAHVRAQGWIDGVVVGMETMSQLSANLGLFEAPPLSRSEAETVTSTLPRMPDTILNPSLWRRGQTVA